MTAIFLVSLFILQLHWISGEIVDVEKNVLTTLNDKGPETFTVTTNRIKENLGEFLEDPLSSINIDYLNNAVILQFRRSTPVEENEIESKRRSIVDKNFMRFGRNDGSVLRFGKRQLESEKDQKTINENQKELRSERSDNDNNRNSRGDNFMRFGRSDNSLMRFGRAGNGLMRFGRTEDLRQGQNLMRFGRNSNLMRFGRGDDRSFMRFGKRDGSLMRFGRSDIDLNRAERGDGFMRFGRTINRFPEKLTSDFLEDLSNYDDQKQRVERRNGSLMRFGRGDSNFMRFGKLDQNFMRFGKRNKLDYQGKIDLPVRDLDFLYKKNPDISDHENSSATSQGRSSKQHEQLENYTDI